MRIGFVLFGVLLSAAAQAAHPGAVPGEVLVKIRAGATANDLAGVEADAGAAQRSSHLATLASGTLRHLRVRGSVQAAIQSLSGNSFVEYAEPNYIVHAVATPNDPRYGELWGLNNTGQAVNAGPAGSPGADIRAPDAWNVTTGTSTVVVGVVDTGIDYRHPDLGPNVWNNPGGINGCPAGTHGYNAINNSCDPNDDQYHGTHCAGTIGAVGNNGVGVVGVNWTTSIMGLKFLDSTGSGTTANAINAIDFAVRAKIAGVNVRVLSNSWGGGGFSQALLDEINKANANDILFVAAAGNNSADNDLTPHYPSSYNTPNMIAVAATDNTDGLAYFSNYGATSVHLGAPGLDILSLQPGGLYQYLSGTSMATPHVSGAAALILSRQTLTTAQLKSAILNNVDPNAALSGITVTGGRLNVCKAIPGCVVTVAPPAGPPAGGGLGTGD